MGGSACLNDTSRNNSDQKQQFQDLWDCDYIPWSPLGYADPIYHDGDKVTHEGIKYRCQGEAYPNDIPNDDLTLWKKLGPCENTGSSTTIYITYATKIVYVYRAATNGDLLNLNENYCMTNQPVELVSNYTIDTILEHNGSITQSSGGAWYFTPEEFVPEGDQIFHDSLKLVYSDNHSCIDTTLHSVTVNATYNVNTNANIYNLKEDYCSVDLVNEITGSHTIDSINGPGTWQENNDIFFNPWTATDSVSQDSSFSIEIFLRDNKGCRYDSSFNVNVYASPEVQYDFENLCVGDYTKFTEAINYGGESDPSLWNWKWNFGDMTSLNHTGYGSDSITEHGQMTTGTYASPAHKYQEPGIYETNLTVTTGNNCAGVYSDTIIIGNIPGVNFEVKGNIHNHPTEFINHTEYANYDPVEMYIWDFDITGEDQDTLTSSATTELVFEEPGVHNVKMKAVTQNGCTDSASKKVPIFPYIEVNDDNPYSEYFTEDSCGWLPSHSFNKGNNSGWRHKEVEHPYNCHPNQTGKLWHTGDPDDNLNNENSWVESPCFDFRELSFPLLSLDIFQAVEEGRDGAVVQYSLDDGKSWNVLGAKSIEEEMGLKWYNRTGIVSSPGNQAVTGNIGWSKKSQDWQTSRYPIDQVRKEAFMDTNATCVRFRVAYSSDNGNIEDPAISGFAFDNFMISQRSRKVMLEQFINYPFDSIVAAREENWLTEFVEARPQEVVDMRYHNFIGLTKDSLFFINPPDISSRSVEYGANYTQLTMVDGLHRCVADNSISAKDSVEKYYNKRTLIDKRFNIEVEIENTDSTLDVTAHVTKLTDKLITGPGSQKSGIRMAIVQKEYIHGQDTAKNLMVELLPNGIGNVVDYIPDDFPVDSTFSVQDSWKPNVTTIGNEYRLVVYVQGIWGIDEIHQVWFTDLDSVPQVEVEEEDDDDDDETTTNKSINGQSVNLYPNPAKNQLNVEWEQPLKNIVNWKLLAISGKIMKEGKITAGRKKEKINVRGMHEGIYVLILEDPVAKILEKRKIIILE
jgi:hypothetical protein